MSPVAGGAWSDYREAASRFSRPARLYLLGEFLVWTAHGIFQVLFNLYLVEAAFQPGFVGRAVSVHGARPGAGGAAGRLARRALGPPAHADAGRVAGRHRPWRCASALRCRALILGAGCVIGRRPGAAPDRGRAVPDRALHAARAHAPVQHVLRERADRGRDRKPARRRASGRGVALCRSRRGRCRARVPGRRCCSRPRSRCCPPCRSRVSAISSEERIEDAHAGIRRADRRKLYPIALNALLIGIGAGLVIPFMNLYFATRFHCSQRPDRRAVLDRPGLHRGGRAARTGDRAAIRQAAHRDRSPSCCRCRSWSRSAPSGTWRSRSARSGCAPRSCRRPRRCSRRSSWRCCRRRCARAPAASINLVWNLGWAVSATLGRGGDRAVRIRGAVLHHRGALPVRRRHHVLLVPGHSRDRAGRRPGALQPEAHAGLGGRPPGARASLAFARRPA